MLCYSKGKKKRVWGSEGSHYRQPHDLGLPAVARGYSGTAPLPTDAKDICRRVQALWKRPACSQLEPAKHSARRLPGAGCRRQSKRGSSVPNILFSKQLLHAKQREDRNIRGVVSWQPTGRQCLFPELHSPPSVTGPGTSLACCGNAYTFPKRNARQDKSFSQAKYNSRTKTSVSLLDVFQSMCFEKSLSYLPNTKIKFSIVCNE